MKSEILVNMRALKYYEKDIFVFDVKSNGTPQAYEGEYYERNASSVIKLESTDPRYMEMMKRVIMSKS